MFLSARVGNGGLHSPNYQTNVQQDGQGELGSATVLYKKQCSGQQLEEAGMQSLVGGGGGVGVGVGDVGGVGVGDVSIIGVVGDVLVQLVLVRWCWGSSHSSFVFRCRHLHSELGDKVSTRITGAHVQDLYPASCLSHDITYTNNVTLNLCTIKAKLRLIKHI